MSSRPKYAASAARKLKRLIANTLLMALAITVLYPLAWTIMSSIRNPQEFFLNPWGLPSSIEFSVYSKVWHEFNVGHALFNSLTISILTVLLSLVLSLTASFAIARMRWRFSNVVLGFLLAGLMIPGHSTIIPFIPQLDSCYRSCGSKKRDSNTLCRGYTAHFRFYHQQLYAFPTQQRGGSGNHRWLQHFPALLAHYCAHEPTSGGLGNDFQFPRRVE